MKTNIFIKSLMALAVAGTVAGCDENSWNNNLDGFEDEYNKPISNEQTVEYTLTDADYAAIASNAANKALAGDALAKALAAVNTNKAFSDEIPAKDYVPAFLASTSFQYFTLTDGSAVKLTYNVAGPMPEGVAEAADAQRHTVSTEQYQAVWESEEDFVETFTPSKPAGNYLPGILDESLTADPGEFAIVSYNYSEQEPIFGNVGGGDEKPEFELSNIIATVEMDGTYTINAIVTAMCAQGIIVTDNSGSIFVYYGKEFDTTSVAIGDQVTINATVGAYNKGFQLIANNPDVAYSLEVVGNQVVEYPAAKVYTGADLDQAITRTDNAIAEYVQMDGTVAISGYNINIVIDGAETAKGSAYQATEAQKALFVDGENVSVKGYFIAIAGGKYCSIVVTEVDGTPVAAAPGMKAPAGQVPTVKMNAVYRYNGSKWAVPADFIILQPQDYTDMGQKYQNLEQPAQYLPTFLGKKFAYATEGTVKNVLYLLYAGGSTSYACDSYIFNGTEWVLNRGIVTETKQFVRNSGKWMFDPNVTLTLPYGKGQEISQLYYQACTDWVLANVPDGRKYVPSYNNNEYYSGTSAYQNDIDHRVDKAREQYPEAYASMTDDEVLTIMKKRFMEEVMPGALSMIHPDAAPIPGLDVIYTINFVVYDGANKDYTARFKVTAPGKFEPIDCTRDAKK